MAPRLPGQPPPTKVILRLVVRTPGIRYRELLRQAGCSDFKVDEALRELTRKHILFKRTITDPNHDNYGYEGYFHYE